MFLAHSNDITKMKKTRHRGELQNGAITSVISLNKAGANEKPINHLEDKEKSYNCSDLRKTKARVLQLAVDSSFRQQN